MKKTFFLLITLLLAAGQLVAQEVETAILDSSSSIQKQRHWSFGVTGGLDRNYHIVDMSYMSEYRYTRFAEGGSFGVQIGYTPVRWLTLRVDGVMLQKNYYRSHRIGSTDMSLPDTTINQYVNVPVVLMLNVGKVVRLHAFGGGYWGQWLKSTRRGVSYGMNGLVSYESEVDFESAESLERDNRTDVGLVWGVGLSGIIKSRFELGVEAKWYYGLYDIQKDYMAHLNPRYNTTFVIQGGVSVWL